MSFYVCMYLRNHHPAQDTDHFQHPPQKPASCSFSVSTTPPEVTTILTSVSRDEFLPVLELHINDVIQCELFCVAFFVQHIVSIRIIHSLCSSSSFLLISNIPLMNILQFIYPFNCWRAFELFPVWRLWIKLPWTFLYMPFGEHIHLLILSNN